MKPRRCVCRSILTYTNPLACLEVVCRLMPKQPSPSQTLAEFESTCGACSRRRKRKAPMMPCPGCRLVHYCNEECQERDRARHSVECGTLAVKSFRLLSSALAGPGVSLMRWIDEATDFVTEFHMLPDELTSKQVEELFARAVVAFCHLTTHDHNARYIKLSVLGFWGTCVLRLRHEAWNQEAYLSAVGEQLGLLPTDGPCWCDPEVIVIIICYGKVLCQLERASEAADFGRRMKPSLEEAARTCEDADGLNIFLGAYGAWLYDLVQYKDNDLEVLAVLKEAEAVFNQVLDMMPGHERPNQVAILHLQLTKVILAKEAFDEALKVAQRGMQFPSEVHEILEQHAIYCLMRLRRYDQAEPLIIDVLVKARRDPKLLPSAELGTVHFHHGVLLSHRGDYVKAHTAFSKAEFYISQVDEATQERYGLLLEDVVLQKVDVLDRMGRVETVKAVERQLGHRALYRPRAVVRTAREELTSKDRAKVMTLLRAYMEDYEGEGHWWRTRTRWPVGDVMKPLELLKDQLEEGSEERAKVEALIERSRTEDEELKQQALVELQREMREGRQERAVAKEQAIPDQPSVSKASRKKRKKRERKRQQQRLGRHMDDVDEGKNAGVDLARLSVEDKEEGPATGGDDEQEADECPMCLGPFDDENHEEGEKTLGCGHRFHDVCIDRWLCKCKEMGLLPTCPMCRSELVRGA